MALIERPSVIADELGIVATKLDDALAAVVTILTERLQGGEPKQRAIAVVRNNMIDLRCDCRHAARKTHLAKRLLAQLMTPPLFPATMRIPIVPSNGSSATCCHSKKEERQSFARRADCPRALALFFRQDGASHGTAGKRAARQGRPTFRAFLGANQNLTV